MMNEILNCIKLIKMYAWEKSFAKAISGMSTHCCTVLLSTSSMPDLLNLRF